MIRDKLRFIKSLNCISNSEKTSIFLETRGFFCVVESAIYVVVPNTRVLEVANKLLEVVKNSTSGGLHSKSR